MRYRVNAYGVYPFDDTHIGIQINVPITLITESGSNELDDISKRKVEEALRLIVDESAKEVFCSSMQKARIYNIYGANYGWDCMIVFEKPSGKTINTTDHFTIEFDWGEAPSDNAKEATIGTSPDATVSTTVFGWLKSIRDYLVGIVTTSPYAKENTLTSRANDIAQTLGQNNDTAFSDSLYGATKTIKNSLDDSTNGLTAIKTKLNEHNTEVVTTHPYAKEATLGATHDSNVSSTVFGWLKSIRDFLIGIVTTHPYAKEATVDGVSASLGTDSGNETAHAKLTALATALSALSTQINTTAPYAKEATLGTSSDAKTVGTVFGKIANLLDVLSSLSTELGTDANNVSVQTKLDALLNALGECSFERNNDGADTWTLVLDRMSSVNNNILDV